MDYIVQTFKIMATKKKIVLFVLYLFLILVGVLFAYKQEYGSIPFEELNYMKNMDPEMGLDFFYLLQDSGLILIIFLSFITLLPNIISTDFVQFKNSKFSYMIVTRITNTKYQKWKIKGNLMMSFLVIALSQVFILIIIQLFCFDLTFEINPIYLSATRHTTIFSNSLMLSLVLYIGLSSIGYSVLSNLIYSLRGFRNNIYLYRTLGLFITLVLYIGSSILTRAIFELSGNMLITTMISFFNISNILSPGIIISPILNHTPILFYIGTIVLYSLLSVFLQNLKEIE